MSHSKISHLISVLVLTTSIVSAFVSLNFRHRCTSTHPRFAQGIDIADMGLTPKLKNIVEGLRSLPDDKMRVKQVLFLASQGEPMADELKIQENKVPGCLSVVHVHATKQKDGTLSLQGDSDAQITKGLVNLLVDGLTGYLPSEIQDVKPEFITYAGLGSSLTPGRNNGFVNMLAVIKRKARELGDGVQVESDLSSVPQPPQTADAPTELAPAGVSNDPLYDAIMAKTRVLKPSDVKLIQESDELSFELTIVADCFEGLPEEKRLQMINTVMRKERQKAKSFKVTALSPMEGSV